MREKIGKLSMYLQRKHIFLIIHDLVEKMGIIRMVHFFFDLIDKKRGTQDMREISELCSKKKSELNEVLHMLEDVQSKNVFSSLLKYRSTKNRKFLKGIITDGMGIGTDIFTFSSKEVFIDCGAYTGDTISEFIKVQNGIYRKIIAFEPDKFNNIDLKKNIKNNNWKDVVVIERGAWSKEGILSFNANEGLASKIKETGNDQIRVDTIDNVCTNLNLPPSFIKMDIEGAELEALRGAESVIKEFKPKLSICVYHKPEDLYMIPLYIKNLVPEYKIYIRHHKDTAFETILYAYV